MESEAPLKILVPQHQRTVREHMKLAGWNPIFDQGKSRADTPENGELNTGIALGTFVAEIRQLRSPDMVRSLASGRFDIAIVGSDCIEEWFNRRLVELGRYSYGREWNAPRPRLEFVALQKSTVQSLKDIKSGSVVYTERKKITKDYMEKQGISNIIVENEYDDPLFFEDKIQRRGEIGIRTALGAIPALLEPAQPDRYFGIMVNEKGDTVNDYNLKVIAKLRDIDAVLVASERSMSDDRIRGLIGSFSFSMNEAFLKVNKESELHQGLARRL